MKSILFVITLFFSVLGQSQDVGDAEYDAIQKASKEYQLALAKNYQQIALLSAEARESKNLMCEEGTYSQEIVNAAVTAMVKAHNADTTVYQQMVADFLSNGDFMKVASDIYSFRKTLLYPSGWSDESAVDVAKKALIQSTFWSPGLGAYGSQISVTFLNETEAEIKTLELLDNEPWTQWKSKIVAYSVSETDAGVIITIDNERLLMKESNYYEQNAVELVPEFPRPNVETNFTIPVYTEYASECEA